MASYSIRFRPSVEKDVRRIATSDLRRIFEQIEALSADPFPRGVAKLAGAEGLYRVRAGNYRIIYEVDQPSHQIVIQYIRHRRDAYRRL